VDLQSDPNLLRVWTSRKWPIAPDDEFWHFRDAYGHGVYLQFRDDRLINFPHADFADPYQLALINQLPRPPWPLRYGVWPYSIPLVAVVGWLLLRLDKRNRALPPAPQA
jgi:hypothetical protein